MIMVTRIEGDVVIEDERESRRTIMHEHGWTRVNRSG